MPLKYSTMQLTKWSATTTVIERNLRPIERLSFHPHLNSVKIELMTLASVLFYLQYPISIRYLFITDISNTFKF